MISPARASRWAAWLLLTVAVRAEGQSDGGRSFLVLDLEGDGLYLTDTGYPVAFDLDGDGEREPTAWTAGGREEAFLWVDENGNAAVDGGDELVSSEVRPGSSRLPAFGQLLALDGTERGGNGDGVLSPLDGSWTELRLWVDRDHDGRSDAGEHSLLADWRIRSIGLDFREVLVLDGSANWIRAEGRFGRAGAASAGRLLEVEFASPRR